MKILSDNDDLSLYGAKLEFRTARSAAGSIQTPPIFPAMKHVFLQLCGIAKSPEVSMERKDAMQEPSVSAKALSLASG